MRYRKRKSLSSNNRIYYYSRYARAETVDVGSLSDAFYGFAFQLNRVINYTEFTNLYDMYKINAIKITFMPQQTSNVSLSDFNNANAGKRFFSAIDRNDANVPSSTDELREYKSAKATSILRPHKRYIVKPKILDYVGAYSPNLS